MTSGSTGGEGLSWLLEPPAPGEVHLHIAIGEGTELTPEVQAALSQLVGAVYQEDVAGFAAGCFPRCPDLAGCSDFLCVPLNNCDVLNREPCFARQTCRITLT
jgi:hypothetical protein